MGKKIIFGLICSCQNGKYLASIMNDSEITCDVKNVMRNVIIFGADMSSSVHIDNRRKDILVLGKIDQIME